MIAGDAGLPGRTDPAYWNRVGPFGGWVASWLLNAVLDDPRRRGDPISTSTNFVGPLEPGTFTVHVRHLRENRSTDFWWSELVQVQGGESRVCAYATTALARRRPAFSHQTASPPVATPPEQLVPRAAPLRLEWMQLFEMRTAATDPLDATSPEHSLTWTRKLGRPLDFGVLTEICDTGLPQIFLQTRIPIPIATVTLNIFFHVEAAELAAIGEDFVLCEAAGRIAHDGFFDEQLAIWSRGGRLLATTEQLAWYRAEAIVGGTLNTPPP